MTFGEFFTKIAIIATGWSTWQSGLFAPGTAIVFVSVMLVLSFLRDANLRHRGIVRMAPTLGTMWLMSTGGFLIITEFLCHWLCESKFMEIEESVMGGSWLALFLQCITVMAEAGNRRAFNYLYGWDEGQFDRLQGRSYGNHQPQSQFRNVQPAAHYCGPCNNYNDNSSCDNNNLVVVDARRITSNRNVPLIPRR